MQPEGSLSKSFCSRVLALIVQTSWGGESWLDWNTQEQFGSISGFYQISDVSCRASCTPPLIFPFFLFVIATFYTKPTYFSSKHPQKSGQLPVFTYCFGRGLCSWLLKKRSRRWKPHSFPCFQSKHILVITGGNGRAASCCSCLIFLWKKILIIMFLDCMNKGKTFCCYPDL